MKVTMNKKTIKENDDGIRMVQNAYDKAHGVEDDCYYESDEYWFGIKGARFIYHGEWADPEVIYDGVSLNYYDIESWLLDIYREDNPSDKNDEGFDAWMESPKNKETIQSVLDELAQSKEAEDLANAEDEELGRYTGEYDESWLGDKVKSGWNKVKDGAKKLGKKIGDAFNGPFRKGDHIVMSGEDGEKVNGTITDYDMGNKTYTVLLGKKTDESTQDDIDYVINGVGEILPEEAYEILTSPENKDAYEEVILIGADEALWEDHALDEAIARGYNSAMRLYKRLGGVEKMVAEDDEQMNSRN